MALTVVTPSLAQEPQDVGTTSRGRVRDTSSLLETQRIADQLGLPCSVSAAAFRGRDDTGGRHYEIACDGSPGWLLIDSVNQSAFDCLSLQSQYERARRDRTVRSVPTCNLSGNRNPERHYAAIASEAGLSCRVDSGISLGRSVEGHPIYEIGCRDAVGAWVERRPDGPIITDCLDIRSLGGRCELTDAREEADALADWVAGSSTSCRPSAARAVGRNPAGTAYFEIACTDGDSIVVARDAAGRTLEVISCEDAALRLEPCRRSW